MHGGTVRISDLSAAEIKKRYREIVSKENLSKDKNFENQSVQSKAIPAEADAAKSDSYKKIHASKMLKGVPAASGGTGTGQVLNSECGSFFNPGDNRISRTVYQEDPLTLSVTSLSFNPTNWECSQCPKKHKILEQGGGGKNSVPVIILSDQNFPGVLPTISGKCLSIVRLEQGKMEELGDLLIKILPKGGLPRGSIVLVGSLSQLQKENVAGYATACVKIVKRFDGFFKKEIRTVPFVPPPMGGCDNPRMGKDILDLCCWLENMADYPLRSAMGFLAKTVDIQEGGGGGGLRCFPTLDGFLPARKHLPAFCIRRLQRTICPEPWPAGLSGSSAGLAPGNGKKIHCEPYPRSELTAVAGPGHRSKFFAQQVPPGHARGAAHRQCRFGHHHWRLKCRPAGRLLHRSRSGCCQTC
jgi:hypothetical protein